MRFKLKSLAIGLGAFFFTYGLPILAQENHLQLFFGIPLASYSLCHISQLKGTPETGQHVLISESISALFIFTKHNHLIYFF